MKQYISLFSLHLFLNGMLCVPEEAAMVLGRDAALLARVMEWCEAKDHAGVRGEASRLLAALIRHSRSPVSQYILIWKLAFVY